MNRKEHLLVILAEECAEVSKLASKCLRFGVDSQNGEDCLSAGESLVQEMCDLMAVYDMLLKDEILPRLDAMQEQANIKKKIQKVEHFMDVSR